MRNRYEENISDHPRPLPASLLWRNSFKVNLCSCVKLSQSRFYHFWKPSEKLLKLINSVLSTCSGHVWGQLYFQPGDCHLKPNPTSLSPSLAFIINPWILILILMIMIMIPITMKTCLRLRWEIQRVLLPPRPPSSSSPPAQSDPDKNHNPQSHPDKKSQITSTPWQIHSHTQKQITMHNHTQAKIHKSQSHHDKNHNSQSLRLKRLWRLFWSFVAGLELNWWK